jgi:hypothetical protein
MKTKGICLSMICLLIFNFTETFAQIGIGTSTPDASSALDVSSTTKPADPRMTQSEIGHNGAGRRTAGVLHN